MLRTNRISIVGKPEVTFGTRVEPVAGDNDVKIISSGQPTLDFGTESLGKLADGTFIDAPVVSKVRKITLPDFMMQVRAGSAIGVEAKYWKYAKACGYKVTGTTTKSITWDGVPAGDTLSTDFVSYSSTGAGMTYKGRGMCGNMSFKAEGQNAPIMAVVSGMTGAFVGEVDVPSATVIAVTGADASVGETMGNYIVTIGSDVYQCSAWEFNPNNEINIEAANNAEGIAKAAITTQAAKLTMTFVKKIAVDTVVEDTLAGTVKTVTILGGAGSFVDFTATGCYGQTPSLDDIEGTVGNTVEYIVTGTFTATNSAV